MCFFCCCGGDFTRFIVGGKSQGKLEYTIKTFSVNNDEIFHADKMSFSEYNGCRCINQYHLFIKQLIKSGIDPVKYSDDLTNNHPELIIIMNEIGSGIIPLEKDEREWRELTGKTGCLLAKKAETVDRVICGIPIRIKGR